MTLPILPTQPTGVPWPTSVWPTGDLGVRRGYGLAWNVPMPSARELQPLGDPYRPYRSLVAWYCWRAVELYAGAADSALTR